MITNSLAIILLLENLYAYQYGLNTLLFFGISAITIILIYFAEKRKGISTRTIFIELLIFTWPFSWTNIFGTEISEFQITWFYIVGLLYLLNSMLTKELDIHNLKLKKKNKVLDISFAILFIYIIIPLIMANDFSNAIPDFIMIIFFLVLVFCAYMSKNKLPKEEFEKLIKSFIFINLISSLVIIFQYLMYTTTGNVFFKMNIAGSFAVEKMQVGSELLFEDASSATIMLGCGVLFSLLMAKENKIKYIFSIIIAIGLAMTSRRTGVTALCIILPLYFLFNDNKFIKKVLSIGILCCFMMVILYFINLSRPMENSSQLFEDNGRMPDYLAAIDVIMENPFGIGYGDKYLASLMVMAIPHNTILRWLCFGGIILAIPMTLVILCSIWNAKKQKNTIIFWSLLYTFLASNFIPDILNARFITVLCILAFLYDKEDKNVQKNIDNCSDL